jgi:kumamolisin
VVGRVHAHGVRLLAVVGFLAFAYGTPRAADAPPASVPVRLPGHEVGALDRAAPIERGSAAEPLTVTVVLKRDDQAGFDRHLAALYDPSSPSYRRFSTQRELADRFGPSRSTYERVRRHLEKLGLESVRGSTNRLTLTVRGTRAALERAFDVRVADFRIGDRTFHANEGDPRLPADIAGAVQAVTGLSNLAQPKPATHAIVYAFCLVVEKLLPYASEVSAETKQQNLETCTAFLRFLDGPECYVAGLLGRPCPPTPPGLTSLQAQGTTPSGPAWRDVDGAGQTIGIVAFDTFDPQDVADYLALRRLPESLIDRLSQVHVNGGATLGPDQVEVLLDVAATLTLAPGANTVVYDAPFTGGGSFQAIFNAMIDDGVTVISNSWAYCEDQTTLADVQSIDSILASAAAAGISVFNASGDTGSTCLDGSPNTVAVPAGSPSATAVGGSSRDTGPGESFLQELWWDGTADTPQTGQGGFGESRFFARPGYQDGFTSSANRSVPDIVFNADPARGFVICQRSAGGCPSGLLYGGTSVAAPVMAAYTALLNQARGSNLGALNPLLYPLAGSEAFHDATALGSDFARVGLGSPIVNRIHLLLSGGSVGLPDPVLSNIRASATLTASSSSSPGIPADGTTPAFVIVRLLDVQGNFVGGKTVTLAATGGATVTPPSGVTSAADGTVTFEVTALTPGPVTLTATDTTDGIELDLNPTLQFDVPPATSAGITAFPTTVTANGSDSTTITVTLQDGLGRPTPGKEIALSQNGGHSIVTGPNPSVTDAGGQIVFTATNTTNETVTYTAIDVTDGDLPVPGSAEVTFSDGTGTACGDTLLPPVGLNGWTVTPFLGGFVAGPLSFGNVNFPACSGATPPGFLDGSVYVANFLNGDLHRLGEAGGTVSSATRLSTIGPTLSNPVLGKDGRLYASRVATTGDFTTGAILELDPETGAIVRTVASNLRCPTAPVVDPLSGDLFYAGQCFGAGSDDPILHRVRDPGGASPTVEIYATLPTTPNGAPVFAPNGSLYLNVGYTGSSRAVIRVSGTDGPTPPTLTTIEGVSAIFWVNIGEVDEAGEARSLIVLAADEPTRIKLVDLTVTPPSLTPIAENIGGGIVGPDGCLYASTGPGVYKLTDPAGGCSFVASNPSLGLSPASLTPDPAQGDTLTFTASFRNLTVPQDTPVFFTSRGANPMQKMARTNAAGQATVQHTGVVTGTDVVVATATVDGVDLTSNKARITWGAGRHKTFLTLNASPLIGAPDAATNVVASLVDLSADPDAPIAGASVSFDVGGVQCTGTTDGVGRATCALTPLGVGPTSLQADYAGDASLTPASAVVGFDVVCPSDLDGVACYLAGFQGVLDAAADEDVKRPVRKALSKKVKKLGKLVDKARTDDRRGEKARKKLPKKLDRLASKVDGLPEKKISAALKAELSGLAAGARSRAPAP